MTAQKNVLGGPLVPCSTDPMTGFWRDGCCRAGPEDPGLHLVCIQATASFLEFSASRGNDLSTPIPQYDFPGVRPGERWCLCATRWQEALDAGHAPPVLLNATHLEALNLLKIEDLLRHALDAKSE
jgi:uncharacterized protein (DUF2237 family)